MADQWHVAHNGKRHGPFNLTQILNGLKSGKISTETLVWKEGMTEWLPVKEMKELQMGSRPVSSPPSLPGMPRIDHETTTVKRPSQPNAGDNPLDYEGTMSGPRTGSGGGKESAGRQRIDFEMTTVGGKNKSDSGILSAGKDSPTTTAPANGATAQGNFPIGTRLGKYIVGPMLGKGGMGVAYRVTDTETGMDYAIKVLSQELLQSPKAVSDLKREVALAKQISHTNLLKVNEFARVETAGLVGLGGTSLALIEMEFVDGENLEEYRVRKGGKISEEDFLKIAPQVLHGLGHLHERGLVHSDIKPQNIMISRDGVVKVADYGVAKTIREQLAQTESKEIPEGTLAYMSPEQLRNEVCDRRSDIYSAGIAFFRLLTGMFPFELSDKESIVRWHLDDKHKLGAARKINEGIASALNKCVSTNPLKRPGSCSEIAAELSEILNPKLEVIVDEVSERFVSLSSCVCQILTTELYNTFGRTAFDVTKIGNKYFLKEKGVSQNFQTGQNVNTIAELNALVFENNHLHKSQSLLILVKKMQQIAANKSNLIEDSCNSWIRIGSITSIIGFLIILVSFIGLYSCSENGSEKQKDLWVSCVGMGLCVMLFSAIFFLNYFTKKLGTEDIKLIDEFCYEFIKESRSKS